MKNKILSGALVKEKAMLDLKNNFAILKQKYNILPKLVIIQVGNDFASSVYIKNKKKTGIELGIEVDHLHYETISQEDLVTLIIKLNNDQEVHGILIQLPLCQNIDSDYVCNLISHKKDVDCFNPKNIGLLFKKNKYDKAALSPCTPSAVIKLLTFYNINLTAKNIVIVGRSNIVGKPLGFMLLQNNATVTICHSYSKNLQQICKKADILICAIGKAKKITKDFIKKDTVLVDVGINRDLNNNVCGDIDFESCLEKCKSITPVPGGVGLITVVCLFENLYKLITKNFIG